MMRYLTGLVFALSLLLLAACGGGDKPPAATSAPPPGEARDLLESGQSALDGGNLDQAVQDLEASAQANPSLDAYFSLGNAYARQGKAAQAIDAYEKALEINPNHAATLSNLGVAYYQQGQFAQAKSMFEKALSVKENDAATHYLLGAVLLQMGDLTVAEKSFARALELQPDLPEAHFGMAMLNVQLGNIDEAIAEFETFLAGPPAQDPRARAEAQKMLDQLRAQQK